MSCVFDKRTLRITILSKRARFGTIWGSGENSPGTKNENSNETTIMSFYIAANKDSFIYSLKQSSQKFLFCFVLIAENK